MKLISKLIGNISDNKTHFYTLETGTIWQQYKEGLPEGENKSKQTFTSPEFGDISQKTLHDMLCDKLHAKPPTHTGKKRELVFDQNTLEKLRQKYRITDKDITNDKSEENQNSKKQENEQSSHETLVTHEALLGKQRGNTQENNDSTVNASTINNSSNNDKSVYLSLEASQASQASQVQKVLGSFVVFDFEWDASNDNSIDAVSFVDSKGNSEVKFRQRDFDGSESALLTYIMAKIIQYDWSIGWNTQGNPNNAGGTKFFDLSILYDRCKAHNQRCSKCLLCIGVALERL